MRGPNFAKQLPNMRGAQNVRSPSSNRAPAFDVRIQYSTSRANLSLFSARNALASDNLRYDETLEGYDADFVNQIHAKPRLIASSSANLFLNPIPLPFLSANSGRSRERVTAEARKDRKIEHSVHEIQVDVRVSHIGQGDCPRAHLQVSGNIFQEARPSASGPRPFGNLQELLGPILMLIPITTIRRGPGWKGPSKINRTKKHA